MLSGVPCGAAGITSSVGRLLCFGGAKRGEDIVTNRYCYAAFFVAHVWWVFSVCCKAIELDGRIVARHQSKEQADERTTNSVGLTKSS